MSDEKLISELTLAFEELKQLVLLTEDKSNMSSITETKKSNLIFTIVNYFYEILSNFFQGGKNYWKFISKHVNGPIITFCKIYETFDVNELENEIEDYERKGKYWIFFNILENSFLDSMKHIIDYFEENYKKNDDNKEINLIKYKKEILLILKELNNFQFNNIINEDYENYRIYLKQNEPTKQNENKAFNDNESPILKSSKFDYDEYQSDAYKDIKLLLETNIVKTNQMKKPEEFDSKKYADFAPSIVDNFYNFFPKGKSINIPSEDSNVIIDDFPFNKEQRRSSGLILSTEVQYRNLPSDELYGIQGNNYKKNDIFIYNKKEKKISNSLLLYINYFYKKAKYYKFFVRNANEQSISLKQQNYQCFICYKKFSTFLGFPIEPIFWCSYFMRYVCKNCISNDYSIIPQLILNEWCFDKCSISKRALNFIKLWYDKPIIYLKKKDELLKNIPESVLKLKKELRNIFNYMKCEDVFNFLDKNIPDFKYIVLKEYIFSLKDLIEIHNRTFIKKLKNIKNIFIRHLKEECLLCKYEGHICLICQDEERIYFYDSEKVIYCKKCKKCFHRNCFGIIVHNH
jgi:hypothetical protein